MSPCDRHRFVFSARQMALAALGVTLAVAALLAAPPADANQNASGTITGYDPQHGTVDVDWNGNTSTFDIGSQNAIIEFQKFGIAPNEIVNFTGGDFRVLNRVVGGDISQIAGQLNASGIVYLVNEAGVHFAEGAMVDVAGLFAAGGNITNQDFLDGVDRFTGLEGNVLNEGMLQVQPGGALHLLGKQVANVGTIKAPQGTVTMIAAHDVWLSESANGRVLVRVRGEGQEEYTELNGEELPAGGTSAELDPENVGVDQVGDIEADDGHVVLGAGDLYSLAVRHAGSTRASGGDVEVVASAGGIELSDNAMEIESNDAPIEAGMIRAAADQITFDLNGRVLAADTAMRLVAPELLLMSDLVLDGGQFGVELDGEVLNALAGEGTAPGLWILSPAVITGNIGDGENPLGWVQMGSPERTGGEVVLGGSAVRTEMHQHYHRRVVFDQTATLDAGDEVRMLAGGEAGATDPRPGLTVDAPLFVIEGGLGGAARLRFLAATGQTVAQGDNPQIVTEGLQLYLLGLEVSDGTDLTLVAELVEGSEPHAQGATVAVLGRTTGGGSLNVEAQDRAIFHDAVEALASLDVVSGNEAIFEADVDVAGPVNVSAAEFAVFEGSVRNFTELNVEAGSVAAIEGDLDSEGSMSLDAGDLAEVLGNITGLSQVQIISGGGAQVVGDIDGVAVFSLEANAAQLLGLIDGVDDFQADVVDFVLFGQDIGGSTALGSFTVNAGQMIGLGNFLEQGATMLVRVDGDILLNAAGREEIPDTATMAAPNLHLESLNGSVIMGQHEKLTALDHLRIDAADEVRVGDLSALGDMVVNAGSAIVLLTRSAALVLVNQDGELVSVMDQGVDYIAGGQLLFSMTPTLSGEGAAPSFASLLPDADAEASDLGPVVRIASLTRADLLTDEFVLDAHAQRPLWVAPIEPAEPTGSLAVALASDGPDVSQQTAIAQAEVWLPADLVQALAELGVDVRGADAAIARGDSIVDDYGIDDERIVVTTSRLRGAAVRWMLDAYAQVMTRRFATPEPVSRADAVRQRLGQAWEDYVEAHGPDAPAEAFRDFLAGRSDQRLALAYLDGLAETLRRAGHLGLTERETAHLRAALLEPVRPEGLAVDTFQSAVTGQAPSRREAGAADADRLGAAIR